MSLLLYQRLFGALFQYLSCIRASFNSCYCWSNKVAATVGPTLALELAITAATVGPTKRLH